MTAELALEKRAANANSAYAGLAGFIRCSIFSESPPVLIYQFSSVADAASFQMRMALNAKPGTYTLKQSSCEAVFEQVDLL
jgi:hypothetical protein